MKITYLGTTVLLFDDGKDQLLFDAYVSRPGGLLQAGTAKLKTDKKLADVIFLGIGGLAKADRKTQKLFFKETIEKVKPDLVIPVHWDNFFSKLKKQQYFMPTVFEKTNKSLYILADYCGKHGINCIVQLPLSSFEL